MQCACLQHMPGCSRDPTLCGTHTQPAAPITVRLEFSTASNSGHQHCQQTRTVKTTAHDLLTALYSSWTGQQEGKEEEEERMQLQLHD
jgi:hypothetical protein